MKFPSSLALAVVSLFSNSALLAAPQDDQYKLGLDSEVQKGVPMNPLEEIK